jgi:hypothetical protein
LGVVGSVDDSVGVVDVGEVGVIAVGVLVVDVLVVVVVVAVDVGVVDAMRVVVPDVQVAGAAAVGWVRDAVRCRTSL